MDEIKFKEAYGKCKTNGDLDKAIATHLNPHEIKILAGALHIVDDYADLTYRDKHLMRTLDAMVKYQFEKAITLMLKQFQIEQGKWADHNFGSDRPARHPLLGEVEEIGELAHAYLKNAQGIRKNEDHRANAQDAIADIIIYLADFCNIEGLYFKASGHQIHFRL